MLRKIFLSAVVGFVYFYLVKLFWGYFPNINPISNGLLNCCASSSWFYPAIQIHDFIINALLCVPLAAFIYKLKSEKLWLCIAAAVIPSFVYGSYHLLQPEYSGWKIGDFAFGWSLELLCLPIAMLLLLLWGRRENT